MYKIEIPNDELYKIFSAPPQRGTLDNRLRKDFSMSRRRKNNRNVGTHHVTFIEPIETIFEPGYQGDTEERPDDAKKDMRELLQLMRREQPEHQRTRRMRIQYSSEPMRKFRESNRSDRKRSSTSQRVVHRSRNHVGRRRTNKFIGAPSPYKTNRRRTSSFKRSSRSNLPLTEINN